MPRIICVRYVDQRRERVCFPIHHSHFHLLLSIFVVGLDDDDDDCGYDPCAWRVLSLFQMMMILVRDDDDDDDFDVILTAEKMMMMTTPLLSLSFFLLDLEEKDSTSCCEMRMRTRTVPGCASADSDCQRLRPVAAAAAEVAFHTTSWFQPTIPQQWDLFGDVFFVEIFTPLLFENLLSLHWFY
jgi:hypothetical protein